MHLRTDTGSANSHFAQVPTISRTRNTFSVAEKHVTTMQFDYLYPLQWKYIYPGDTLNISQNVMARLQTQIKTLFDDLYFDIHAWFVPMRLIQTNWARFQFNAQPTGPTQDNSALTTPNIDLSGLTSGFASKSLYDYFGFPTKVAANSSTVWMNNYLGRAYNLIWNENYRDQNLQNAVTVDLDEGPDNPSDYILLKRGKRHDRFTSALPSPQKGTAVSMPLGTSAPVVGNGSLVYGHSTVVSTDRQMLINGGGGGNYTYLTGFTGASGEGFLWSGDPSKTGLYTDLSSATAATLNQWRQSIAVQHLLEADARSGTRDVESIQARWGVTVPDFRMQRPEYLGGSTFTFDGHVVPQTSATSGSNYQAQLAQFSQTLSSLNITHSFVEHGVFMVLISARSNITYQEGLQRDLTHKTRYDWYQPEFANLGEVSMFNYEIYFQGVAADLSTFGYQEYGYWLRYGMNRVSGEMRSNYTTPLDSMHMADDYFSLPTLGSAWIQSSTPISRNIAVSSSTADPIWINSLMTGYIVRTLPMYSVPGLTRI
nr:MAG: major capsid protein [Microvirus sp.]